jgi:hypothetical protein
MLHLHFDSEVVRAVGICAVDVVTHLATKKRVISSGLNKSRLQMRIGFSFP